MYIYLGYPIILFLFNRLSGRQSVFAGDVPLADLPSITVVVAAFNEESVIEEKIHNLMSLDYPKDRYRIVVSSDASSDKTDIIVAYLSRRFGDNSVLLVANKERRGKTGAINSAMALVTSGITVFTDANVMLDKNALHSIARIFSDSTVGGVAGHLKSSNAGANETTQASSLYWRYEEFIKAQESLCGSTMGADGGIFAIRSELFSPLPEHVLDDFCTSMRVIFEGYDLIYSPDLIGSEKVAELGSEEFARKVRIANRSYNSFRYLQSEIFDMSPAHLWKFISHKLLRWYSFPLLVICLIANAVWAGSEDFLSISWACLTAQLGLYGLAACAWKGVSPGPVILNRISGAAYYFIMANIAAFIGVIQSYTGIKIAVWSSAKSGR